jgi:hypothetical protein
MDWGTGADAAQAVGALAGIVVAGLVAFMPFARRPRLSVIEDTDRVHSRAEKTPVGLLPHVRLLVRNSKRRRAAQGTRVLIEWYQPRGGARVSLANPSLGWPSAPESEVTGTVVVFAGGSRPVSLGRLIRVVAFEGKIIPRGAGKLPHFELVEPPDEREGVDVGEGRESEVRWFLYLAELNLNDHRDKLPPVENGYTIRLLAGADDGAARSFEVDIAWDGDPKLSAEEVLASALDRLALREV